MEKIIWNRCLWLMPIIYMLFIGTINAQLNLRGERTCTLASENVRNLEISCRASETIRITRALYVKPHFDYPDNCDDAQPSEGDLFLDLETILSYYCEEKTKCNLRLEWDMWQDVTAAHAARWPGGAYFLVEYTCAEAGSRLDLIPVPVMVSNKERYRESNRVHVYGCHSGERYPTGVQLDCPAGYEIRVTEALIGKTARPENRCHVRSVPESDPSAVRDITFDLKRTVHHHCRNGESICRVPVDWPNVIWAVETLDGNFPQYNGDLYLDIVYTCVDDNSLTTTSSSAGDIPSDGDSEKSDEGETNAQSGESGSLPLMTFGGIGVAVMILLTIGIIAFSQFIRRRKHPAMNEFSDMEPTYNTTVTRSKHAPPPKFDNILYDADRHPSGVYDIPRSTTTTPGASCNAPPDFAIDVKVEIESDDDNIFEEKADVYRSPRFNINAPLPLPRDNSYVNQAMATVPRVSVQNVNTYSEPYSGVSIDRRRSSATVESYITLNNGQTETLLAGKPVVRTHQLVAAPRLPPRTASMPGGSGEEAHEYDIVARNSYSDNVKEAIVNDYVSSSHNALQNVSHQNRQTESQNSIQSQHAIETSPPIYSDVLKTLSTSGSEKSTTSSRSSAYADNADENCQSPEHDVFEKTSDYYRSMLRHQPVSGVYDNNMENMPKSPYCLRQYEH